MTEILLGPTLTGGATTKVKDKSTGEVFYKKQILPEGKFKYRTKDGSEVELDLTADQHKTFVQSFKDKAYDEVPFQFGAHSNDPTIRKGTMANVEYVPSKGTWGYFKLEQDAAQYVEKYPNFGVSPRLVLDLNRMDGKKFAGAIQHVAGTVVPRASGMSPWEKVELSDEENIEGAEIFDFSDETIAAHKDVKETPVTKTTGDDKTFTLSADEYNFFQEQMKAYQEIMKTQDEKDTTKTVVTLSEEDQKTIAEAKQAAQDAVSGLASIKAQAIRDAWVAKKQLLLSQGVPPAALDLADPVMTDADAKVYDLSDADGDTVKIDARTQMLNLLETMKGTVDLGGERGHGITGIGSEDDVSESDMRAWMNANGI
jgi:hypothetical protein